MRRLLCLVSLLSSVAYGAWSPEVRLTINTTTGETGLNHGALAVDSQGNITAAWAEQDGPTANFQIHTRTKPAGESWGPEELAVAFSPAYAGAGLGAKFPALVALPGDSLLMVWHDYRVAGIQNAELFTKVRPPGEAWGDESQEVRLTTSQHTETNGDNSYMPNLALTPNGCVHVAWYDYRFDDNNAEILFKSRLLGQWNTSPGDPPDTNLSVTAGESHFPALASGADGSLHVAWRDNSSGSFQILYRMRDPQGIWSASLALSPPSVAAAGVDLAVAGDKTVVAVWSDARYGTQNIFLRERSPVGIWGPTRQVSPTGSGAEEPAVQIDAGGVCHVVWQDARVSPFNRELFYQSHVLGAAWDSTGVSDQRLTDAAGASSRPTLLLSGSNQLCLLWQDARNGPTEIYFRQQSLQTAVFDSEPAPSLVPTVNPFRGSAEWTAPGLDFTGDRVRVLDAQGRLVRVLRPQPNRVSWDGRDEQGTTTPPGLYFLQVQDGTGREWHSKVVKLP